jgi:hypothetical protein
MSKMVKKDVRNIFSKIINLFDFYPFISSISILFLFFSTFYHCSLIFHFFLFGNFTLYEPSHIFCKFNWFFYYFIFQNSLEFSFLIIQLNFKFSTLRSTYLKFEFRALFNGKARTPFLIISHNPLINPLNFFYEFFLTEIFSRTKLPHRNKVQCSLTWE